MVEEAKKKILITGICGMLGKDLVSRLKRDYRLMGLELKPCELEGIDVYQADITEFGACEELFKRESPWLVIHAAAFTDVDGCQNSPAEAASINEIGTVNIARLCSMHKAKLVYISTDYVFDGEKGLTYQETDQTNPLNVYGQTKLNGEIAVSKYLKEYLIIRTSWLFGRAGKNFVETIIAKALERGELRVVNDQRGSPTYTVSLADGIAQLIMAVFERDFNLDKCGIYHITNAGHCSWFEFAAKIIELKNIKAKVLPVTSSEFKRPAKRPSVSILDNKRFDELTGKKLCLWQQALDNYLHDTVS